MAAKLAQAHSDVRAEGRAIRTFLLETEDLGDGSALVQALLAAAHILEGASSRCTDAAALASWGARWVLRLLPAERRRASRLTLPESSYALAALALVKTGRVPMPPALAPSLDALARTGRGSVWLWALAHYLFADAEFRTLALAARLPEPPLMQSFALLRRYQLTGEPQYLVAARRAARLTVAAGLPDAATASLVAELYTPETASPPPFRSLFGVPLR